MSLKVWLPLNGNLNNQGLGPQPKLDGVATYGNGKIGQARLTGGAKFTAAQSSEIFNDNGFTYCAWIYVQGEEGEAIKSPNCFFGRDGTPRIFAIFQYPKVDDLHLSWTQFNDDKSSSIYKAGGTWNDFFNVKTWIHLAITYKTGKITIYKNGVQYATTTGTPTWSTQPGGYEYETWALTNTPNAYFNDIRIYDECLSQKQIKEISKGLVCHYKLVGEKPNRNYILNSAFSGKTAAGLYTFNEDVVTFETDAFNQSGNSFALSINPSAIENFKGKNLTFSMEYKIDTALTFGTTNPWVGFEFVVTRNATTGGSTQWLSWYGGKNIPTSITSEWIKYSKTVFVQPEDIASVGINFYFRDTTGKISFRHPKIEIGTKATEWRSTDSDYEYDILDSHENVITDCSGYRNNLIQAESIIFNPDSPKYDGSTQVGGANANRFYAQNILLGDNSTICCWICPKDLTSTTQWIYHLGNGSGTASDIQHGMYINSSAIVWDVGVQGSYSYALQNNQWYFIATTTNGTTSKLYLNGTEVKTLTPTYIQKTVLTLCNRSGNSDGTSSGGYPFKGSISDVRVYATALSAEEILTLYKNSGIIDNNNSVYTREFNEPKIQSSLNQMPTNVNRSGAALTATLEDEPTSITGKATKFLCTTAGSGWYWSGWGKNDLVNGEQYVLTMYVKSPNRTAFRMNIEASSAGYKNYTIGTEYTKIEYPFIYNSSTSYSALTCYQSPALAIDDEIWIHSVVIYKANEYNKNKVNKNGIWTQNEFNERLLPDGYTQLEYLESTGTQWIDTNFKLNQNSRIKINFYQNSYSSGFQIPFGTRVSNTYQFFIGGAHQNGRNDWYYRYGSILHDPNLTGNPNVDGYHEADLNGRIYKLDDYIYVFSPTTFQTNYNCYIFGVNAEGVFDTSLACSMKLYSFLLWDNEKLIRNYIPALRESDKEPGLYDLVNNEFYTNAGTGEFKYILKDIPSDYIQLEYIQSSGTQYINTNVTGNVIIKTIFKIVASGSSWYSIIWSENAANPWGCNGLRFNNSQFQLGCGSTISDTSIPSRTNTLYVFEGNTDPANYYLKINNELKKSGSTTGTLTTNPIYIFANNQNGSAVHYSKIQLYLCQIWQNNELVRDFIPVKRKSDDVLGMYDKVNNTFYINAGTGTFTGGDPYAETANVKIYKETNALEANEFWEI